MSNLISPLAYVDPSAKLGDGNQIGPFTFIDKGVEIGDNNVLMNNVSIHYGARIGNGNTFFPCCSISTLPQDLKFKGEDSVAIIGNNNSIRENVTISRGTASKGKTVLGNNNLLMENVHVAHDCILGNSIIIGNSSKMAGEVEIEDYAVLSAVVLIHQFCRIGGYVMIQGGSHLPQEVPPYVMVGRYPTTYFGINVVGLRRRGFSNETIELIHNAYRIIYQSGLNTTNALNKIEEEMEMTPEIKYIVDFIRSSKRGIISGRK
jgi:UDP-N-acetylglucosamine acyltransferase